MIVALIALAVVITVVGVWLVECSPKRRRERLLDELYQTDRAIETEFRRARQAMNDATGQSWRNLAG